MVTRSSNFKRTKADPLAEAVGATAAALLAGRPNLGAQEIFEAMLRGYAAVNANVPAPVPVIVPAPEVRKRRPRRRRAQVRKKKGCRGCRGRRPAAPGRGYCKPCLDAGAERKRRWTAAKQAKTAARVTPISSARNKRKTRRRPRPLRVGAAAAKKKRIYPKKAVPETFPRGKRAVFEALDHANDGLVTRYLEILDDASVELRELSEAAGRTHRWQFKTWRDAIDWITPPRSFRWRDVDAARLRRVSDAMKGALTAGGGGLDALSRHGLAFPGLRLPLETEAVLDRQKEAEGYFDQQAQQMG